MEEGVSTLLVAADEKALPFWTRLGFGPVPDSVPAEWQERLLAQFASGSMSVLCCDLEAEAGRGLAQGLAPSIEGLIGAANAASGHAAKRQRH